MQQSLYFCFYVNVLVKFEVITVSTNKWEASYDSLYATQNNPTSSPMYPVLYTFYFFVSSISWLLHL